MSEVKVYSTPTCPWCVKVKAFFKEKNVEFDDINVAEDQEAAQQMIEKSGQMGVPQIEINGKMIIGFDQAALIKEIQNFDPKKAKDASAANTDNYEEKAA